MDVNQSSHKLPSDAAAISDSACEAARGSRRTPCPSSVIGAGNCIGPTPPGLRYNGGRMESRLHRGALVVELASDFQLQQRFATDSFSRIHDRSPTLTSRCVRTRIPIRVSVTLHLIVHARST